MKKVYLLSALLLLGVVNNSNAWSKLVYVFCDGNTNGLIDQGDSPLAGMLVVVTNASGTFTASGITASDGSVTLDLPSVPDTYVDFIDSGSLPQGTTAVLPGFGQFSTSQDNQFVTNSFLVESAVCAQMPPPSQTNQCWLTGGGTIGALHGPPQFSFGGVVYPGCKATAAGGGSWNVLDHADKLHLKATAITVVQCGNLPGFAPGSTSPQTPFNFIDFSGSGILQAIGGKKASAGKGNSGKGNSGKGNSGKGQSGTAVFFTARAADLGEPGKEVDQFYLRVYDSTGQTLLVISATPDSPEAISPVPIRSGNLQLHISGCDR